MWRVAGSSFRLLSTVQPEHVGQEYVERDRGRHVLARQRQRRLAAVGDDALEALVPRQTEQHARVVRIVVDDEQHAVAFADVVAVVGDDFLGLRDREDRQSADAAWPAAHLTSRQRVTARAGPV